jgi:hypothetical protein
MPRKAKQLVPLGSRPACRMERGAESVVSGDVQRVFNLISRMPCVVVYGIILRAFSYVRLRR